MSALADGTPLSCLSIPGAHDGPAGIIMMDFAKGERSGSTPVGGKALVEAVYGRD